MGRILLINELNGAFRPRTNILKSGYNIFKITSSSVFIYIYVYTYIYIYTYIYNFSFLCNYFFSVYDVQAYYEDVIFFIFLIYLTVQKNKNDIVYDNHTISNTQYCRYKKLFSIKWIIWT